MKMSNMPRSFVLAAAVLWARTAGAQGGAQIPQTVPQRPPTAAPGQFVESCIAGRVFGITQFQCTHCGMASPRDSTRVVYTFGAEPHVVDTDNPTNRIKPGDYVVAVNGHPITTRAGADQFAYPPMGTATLTVRRNNVNINIDQMIMSPRYCPANSITYRMSIDTSPRASASGVMAGRGGGGGRGGRIGSGAGGLVMMRTDSTGAVTFIDTAVARMRQTADSLRAGRGGGGGGRAVAVLRGAPAEIIGPTVQSLRFGLTMTCHPTCTRARTRDGTAMYWRFDSYPTVTNPSPVSIAGKAGLQHDDVIITVNGISPQVEEGALILNRADRETSLELEIRRAGKTQKITLKQ
jgi:hypothetical protein